MADAVRLSDEQFASTYQQAFTYWTGLHRRATGQPVIPSYALSCTDAVEGHPSLPRNLDLEHDTDGVYATGSSICASTHADCPSEMPSFSQPLSIKVAVRQPTTLHVSQGDGDNRFGTSLFQQSDNYLSILILAWSYILSARWAETMPGHCTIAYTVAKCAESPSENVPTADQVAFDPVLQDASAEEIRCWTAVLAPGQGWQAHMELQHKTYASPWSVTFQADCRFIFRHTAADQSSTRPAVPFVDALTYLDKFCSAAQ